MYSLRSGSTQTCYTQFVMNETDDSQPLPPGLNLNSKQRAFVNIYIQTGGNAPEAAMRAYDCSDRNSARVMTYKGLHNPKVLAHLEYQLRTQEVRDEALESLKETLSWALRYAREHGHFPTLEQVEEFKYSVLGEEAETGVSLTPSTFVDEDED